MLEAINPFLLLETAIKKALHYLNLEALIATASNNKELNTE